MSTGVRIEPKLITGALSPQHRSQSFVELGEDAFEDAVDFLFLEGVVGGLEGEAVSEGLLARRDLTAGIDVE
jgi:hypothetical protein